jgi:peptidyl-prolyl cis-trans isomerase SurA
MRFSYIMFLVFSATIVSAQDNSILFTIDGEPTYKNEFEYVYKKNNFNNTADYSKASLEEYYNLYSTYKLKVKEAYAKGLDTIQVLKDEYSSYEKQLFESHLDKQVLEKLTKQEYERSKNDVSVSHIYVKSSDPNAESIINTAYNQLQLGQSFESVCKNISQDEITRDKGGYLGYFNVLQINFPELEDASYSTPKGSFTKPIKTSIGYHIIKVNDIRPALGKIRVAIIKKLFKPNASETEKLAVKKTSDSIYTELKKGASFAEMAVKYSEDYYSNFKGGELDWFGINTYAPSFEETAFGLINDGDIAVPIMTNTACYIIKRIERQQNPKFEDIESALRTRLLKSQMYYTAYNEFCNKLKTKYNFSENNEVKKQFQDTILHNVDLKNYATNASNKDKIVFSINNQPYTIGNIYQNLFNNIISFTKTKTQEERVQKAFEKTINDALVANYSVLLPKEDLEYKILLDEYKNGVLIFDLIKSEIWDKTNSDSIALANYYKTNSSNYKWNKRAAIRLISLANEAQIKTALKTLKKNTTSGNEALTDALTKSGLQDFNVEEQLIEEGKGDFSKFINWKVGIGKNAFSKDNVTYIYQIRNIIPEQSKSFEETKGYVMAGYQEYLEKKWIESLKNKYKLVLNQNTFNSLIKK